jgi:hypothetical protein
MTFQRLSREILIADAQVEDLDILLAGLAPNVETWLVQPGDDAVARIFTALATPGLNKLHLLAHGMPGGIALGGKRITIGDFTGRYDGTAQRDLDIAFWSCETGAGEVGQAFVAAVAQATGARVAAAEGLVGNAERGGNWNLGSRATAPFSAIALQRYDRVLALPGNVTSDGGNPAKWTLSNSVDISSIDLSTADPSGHPVGTIDLALGWGLVMTAAQAGGLNFTHATTGTVEVKGVATVAQAIAAGTASVSNHVTLDNGLSDTVTGFFGDTESSTLLSDLSALQVANGWDSYGVTVTVTGDPLTIAQLTAVNTLGVNVAGAVINGIADTAANLDADASLWNNGHNTGWVHWYNVVTVTDGASVAQVADLRAANSGLALTLSAGLSDTVANLTGHTTDGGATSYSVVDTANHLLAASSVFLDAAASVTVTGSVAAADLNALASYTAAAVYASATAITGTAVDINTALLSRISYNFDPSVITVTGATAASDLNAIHDNTSAPVDASGVPLITGTAADIATALSASVTTHAANVAVTATGTATASDLNIIDAYTTATVDATGVTAITGSASAIAAALGSAGITHAANVAVTVAGTAAAADLNIIDANTTATADASGVSAITGTSADIAAALGSAGITHAASVAVTVTGSAAAADLNAIDGNTTAMVNAMGISAITGTAADIITAFETAGIMHVGNVAVTVTGAAAASALNDIDNNITTTVDASGVTAITGTAAAIATALGSAGIAHAANVAVTVTGTTAAASDLNIIDANTTATVVASGVTAITGAAADVASALGSAGITHAANVAVTVTGMAAASDLNIIDANTTATVVASGVTAVTGTAADIATAFGSAGMTHAAATAVTVLDEVSAAQAIALKTDAGAGTVTLSGGLSDTAAHLFTTPTSPTLVSGLPVLTGDSVTVSDAVSAAQANALAAAVTVTGSMSLLDGVSDTAANLFTGDAVNTAVSTLLGHFDAQGVTIVDAVDVAQAQAMLAATTINGDTLTLSGGVSDTVAHLFGSATGTTLVSGLPDLTGDSVTVSGAVSVAQAAALETAVTGSGTLTLSGGVSDTLAHLFGSATGTTLVSGLPALTGDTVTVSGAVSVAQALALAGAGAATLSGNVSDTVAHLFGSATGTTLVSGLPSLNNAAVTVTDAASVAQLTALHTAAGDGTVSYGTITDTAAHLATLTGAIWSVNAAIKSGTNVIVSNAITAAELTAIDLANGSGTVTALANLPASNFYAVETASTPSWTVATGVAANVVDAAGAQTIHIAAGGTLNLSGSDGNNVIVFDNYLREQLHITSSGTTVIFSDASGAVASIATDAVFAATQTIQFSDGSQVSLTDTSGALAINGVTIVGSASVTLPHFVNVT